jgi:hypothetical protein
MQNLRAVVQHDHPERAKSCETALSSTGNQGFPHSEKPTYQDLARWHSTMQYNKLQLSQTC